MLFELKMMKKKPKQKKSYNQSNPWCRKMFFVVKRYYYPIVKLKETTTNPRNFPLLSFVFGINT